MGEDAKSPFFQFISQYRKRKDKRMFQTPLPNLETYYGKFRKVYLTTTRLDTCLNIEHFILFISKHL